MTRIYRNELPAYSQDNPNTNSNMFAKTGYFEQGTDFKQFKKDYIDRNFLCLGQQLDKNLDTEDKTVTALQKLFKIEESTAKSIIHANTQSIGAFLSFILNPFGGATTKLFQDNILIVPPGSNTGEDQNSDKFTKYTVNICKDEKDEIYAVNTSTGFPIIDMDHHILGYVGPATVYYKLVEKKIDNKTVFGYLLDYIETDDPIIIAALKGEIFKSKDDFLKMALSQNELLAITAINSLEEQNKSTPSYLKPTVDTVLLEGKTLLHALRQSKDVAELQSLITCLNAATDTLKNPTIESANKLYNTAQTQANGKPSPWKKFIGGCVVAAGLTLIALGIVGMVATFGASLGLAALGATVFTSGGYAIGGAFVLGGAAEMFSGRQKGFSNKIDQVTEKISDEIEQHYVKRRRP